MSEDKSPREVDTETEVYLSPRTSEDDLLRQRDELCRSSDDLEGNSRGDRARSKSCSTVRSRGRLQLRLDTAQGTAFRRSMGSGGESGENAVTAYRGQRTSHNRREALTPAHLLIGSSLRSLPPEPVPERQTGCLKRWQLLCWLKQQFWLKWSKEYLLGLQARSKWVQEQPNLVVGKLVLIHEDNSPPQRWKTGRVIGVVEGQDGKVRVADVKTSSGVLRRPIVKLAPLPDEEY
ncbi:uncharacterized protein LOC129946237 [Eupeodes corollae]|uniref:uncharacterized protein LOC129946237 n=1 Tax=Eupeodes corollae TaxID=290404 RepID=UPI002490EBF7|nr:uncharacterized protein LOC129946237 [Eupeodes corollae]